MGHRLTPEQERQALRDATREAHETLQGLYTAIREAKALAHDLVASFDATHEREIQLLSNHLIAESNRISAQLNDTIHACQKMIIEQIMAGEAVFDISTQTVTIKFGDIMFDDHQPPPYPLAAPKENRQ